jgi:hypothetical protein
MGFTHYTNTINVWNYIFSTTNVHVDNIHVLN